MNDVDPYCKMVDAEGRELVVVLCTCNDCRIAKHPHFQEFNVDKVNAEPPREGAWQTMEREV